MSEAEDVEVVASGLALKQVSQWLGESAEDVLHENDAATDGIFEKPRPSLLGLGARYLSHKSMENSGLEMKLKHRLKQSMEVGAASTYEPAQLDRHQRKRKHADGKEPGRQAAQQRQQQRDSDDEESGKLHALKQGQGSKAQPKVFDRQQLLAVPVENLSKWQRKRMRQKAKLEQEQQAVH